MECLPVVYGLVTRSWILSGDPGNERIQEIAHAIQQGASAYLTRQYRIIGIVGLDLFVIIIFFAGSGIRDRYRISGRCRFVLCVWFYRHERVGQGKRPYGTGRVKWHAGRMSAAFRGGPITGMLVAGAPRFFISF